MEKALSILAEDIVDDVVEFACKMAKHRGSNVLHRNDVKMAFEKRMRVKVPTRLHTTTGPSAQASSAKQVGQVAALPQIPLSTKNYTNNLALVKKA